MKDRRIYSFVVPIKYTSKLRSEWLTIYCTNTNKKRERSKYCRTFKKNETMSKGNDSKVKSDKKSPAKSLKEKRAAKAVKREEKKSE